MRACGTGSVATKNEWQRTARSIAAARQLLARYDYTADMAPPLVPDRSVDDALDAMLRKLK